MDRTQPTKVEVQVRPHLTLILAFHPLLVANLHLKSYFYSIKLKTAVPERLKRPKTMTLTEYLNQENPTFKPFVLLNEAEYRLGDKINLSDKPNDWIQQITILAYPQYFYVIKGDGGGVVYATDERNLPNRLTCFNI